MIGNIAGGLVAPLVNKRSIRAQYLTTNARQLQAVYNYQRTSSSTPSPRSSTACPMAEKFTTSVEIKKQQLRDARRTRSMSPNFLFQNGPHRDRLPRRALRPRTPSSTGGWSLIEAKTEQLASIVNTYQALGGGLLSGFEPRRAISAPSFPVHPHGSRRRELPDDLAAVLQV